MGYFKGLLKEGFRRAVAEYESNSGRRLNAGEKDKVDAMYEAYKDILSEQMASRGVTVLEEAKFNTVKEGVEKVIEYLNSLYPVARTVRGDGGVIGEPVRSPILEDLEEMRRRYESRIRNEQENVLRGARLPFGESAPSTNPVDPNRRSRLPSGPVRDTTMPVPRVGL